MSTSVPLISPSVLSMNLLGIYHPLCFYLLIAVFLGEDVSRAADVPDTNGLSIATFDIDVTPPVGSLMAYDRAVELGEIGLRCRGVLLVGAGDPIVLCAVDWIGIGNESQDVFRERIAKAAGTTADRVAVHTLHQHDAPRSDFGAEQQLHHAGVSQLGTHDGSFAREVLDRLVTAIEQAAATPTPITHAGFGTGEVRDVASNRRIQDDSGQVVATRYTANRDAKLRAMPIGTIDPALNTVSFYNHETPVAVLSFYACHPQSYYRTGIPSPDFPGLARFMCSQDKPGPLYVHFNGAGGNIGAGKFNDGSPGNRLRLARRVADAMQDAYSSTTKFPISADNVRWSSVPVALPPAKHLDREKLTGELSQRDGVIPAGAASKLAWLLRCQNGEKIDIACLGVGEVRVLLMPGELFVEYQLAAKALRPDLKVAMAAYGDYGPGYIGTSIAYGQGGYETSPVASNVGPETEPILMQAIKTLLNVEDTNQ